MGNVNSIAFDKTGTLTYGNLEVSDIIPLKENISKKILLKYVTISEVKSEHPIGKAIVKYSKNESINYTQPEEFKMIPGKGVSAVYNNKKILSGTIKFMEENNITINSESIEKLDLLRNEGKASIVVSYDNELVGIIGLSDVLRETAPYVVNTLINDLDTDVELLTGDNHKAANYFASKVGITNIYSELLPENKVEIIEQLKCDKKTVCMVGDGINDAPALKTADVSVAMGGMGSDIAIDAADIALLGDDIEKIPYLKRLSNSTLFTIKFNIALSMMINAIAIICSVLGLLNPVTGAIVHNAGSCLVVLNAALLYDRNFDKNRIHSHYHYHDDGKHAHSHENVEILGEIHTSEGVKHIHSHRHSLKFKSHCSKL